MGGKNSPTLCEEEDTRICEEKEVWSDSEDDIEYNQELID